jgi:hypothetical protein
MANSKELPSTLALHPSALVSAALHKFTMIDEDVFRQALIRIDTGRNS